MPLHLHQFAPPAQLANLGFRFVGVVLGVLLLTTASLKVHGLALDPVSQDSFLASPRLQIGVIELETILGLWLLSGWSRQAAWVAALGFFGILAGASLHLALTGQPSCGCFGRLTVSPWLALGLDLAVVTALLVCRPAGPIEAPAVAWLRGLLKSGVGAAGLLVLVGSAFLLAFDKWMNRLIASSIT
jgi:hypothetical protein